MDAKNKQLLTLLLDNSRQSLTQLAKKLELKKETVHYRLKKLEEEYILQYYTVINHFALDYKRYGIYFQFKNISIEEEKELIDFIKKHPFTTYIGTVIGRWNVVLDILAKDEKQVQEILMEINIKAKNKIEKQIITSSFGNEESYHNKFFPTEQNFVEEDNKTTTKINLDEINLKILSLLAKNSRISYAKLSTQLDMTANGIKKRIKNLEQQRVILSYTISLDFHKFGFESYNIQVKVKAMQRKKLIQFLRGHPAVFFIYNHIANQSWDIDVGIFVKSNKDTRDFLIELKEKFGEEIQIYDIFIVAEIIKDNIAPKGIFKK